MLRQLLIIFYILNTTDGWVLHANKNTVTTRITSNVTIECYDDNSLSQPSKMSDTCRIRITKYNTQDNSWETVARISKLETSVTTSLTDAITTGHSGKIHNTFLKIDFEVASTETVGQFRCEIDGFDAKESPVLESTSSVDIQERGKTYEDILATMLELRNQEKNDQEISQNEVKDLILSLTKKVNTLYNVLNIPDQREALKSAANWPAGVYTLPRPELGCPKTALFDWIFGSLRVSTVPDRYSNRDSGSVPLHLSGNTFQYNNVSEIHHIYTETCSKTTVTGTNWPNGSYCVQMYSTCPEGLQQGELWFRRYNDDKLDTGVNVVGSFFTSEHTYMDFCCMEGGDPTIPIVLPRNDPFYLYRFGGKCQEVVGMVVYEEWIHYDTYNSFGGSGYSNNYHPDGSADSHMRIYLCYYVPI